MSVTSVHLWEVGAGLPFLASLANPPGVSSLGARIETPVFRGIVDYYKLATLQGEVRTVTMTAPAAPGPYELVWRDNDGLGPGGDPTTEIFVPIVVVAATDLDLLPIPAEYLPVSADAVRPDVDDVAKLERARCVDQGGTDQGTFTELTHPTAAEVEDIVDQAIDDILVRFPVSQLNPIFYRTIQRAVTLHAAILIEGSYFREQANDHAVLVWQQLLDQIVGSITGRITVELEEQQAVGGATLGRVLY